MMATTSTSSPFTPSYLLSLTSSISNSRYPLPLTTLSSSIFRSSSRKNSSPKLFCYSQSAISRKGTFDPELRSVLELATDSELYEIESILFGPSYFSPLLKSIENKGSADFIMIEEDFEERNNFIELLESRFLYLGADARSTLRGWRPSYRDILLSVRRKLSIPCNSKLSTEDLEVEIFLHLLQEYSSLTAWTQSVEGASVCCFEDWGSGAEVNDSEGRGMLTLAKVYQLLARRLSGKMLFQAANYQVRHKLIREGGKLAAINLESRAALLAAGQGLAGAASRYLGLRSMMMLLGPMLWGTFLADVVIQMLGTDYARILRAIYAFAQIRVTHTYKWETDKNRFA